MCNNSERYVKAFRAQLDQHHANEQARQDAIIILENMGIELDGIEQGYISFDSEQIQHDATPYLWALLDRPTKSYVGISPSNWD
jgi:hypothetical protein